MKDRKEEFKKIKELIKEFVDVAEFGLFDTRNIVGDHMITIYKGKYFILDICFGYGYFEVFGTTHLEFWKLSKYYSKLIKKLEVKE